MTKEKMRIKIAEILGIHLKETKWRFSYNLPNVGPPLTSRGFPSKEEANDDRSFLKTEGWICKEAEHYEVDAKLPNWPEDLNACRDFEQTLKGLEIGYYMDWIVPSKIKWMTGEAPWRVCHASALQRCEAFLRVHNAWEEDEAE